MCSVSMSSGTLITPWKRNGFGSGLVFGMKMALGLLLEMKEFGNVTEMSVSRIDLMDRRICFW